MPESSTIPVPSIAAVEPLLLDIKQTAKVLGISVRTLSTWDILGKVPSPIRLCRRLLWSSLDLKLWAQKGFPSRQVFEQLKESEAGR
jgi:predicted DNA-binding transcriptional regulator AlpA